MGIVGEKCFCFREMMEMMVFVMKIGVVSCGMSKLP